MKIVLFEGEVANKVFHKIALKAKHVKTPDRIDIHSFGYIKAGTFTDHYDHKFQYWKYAGDAKYIIIEEKE